MTESGNSSAAAQQPCGGSSNFVRVFEIIAQSAQPVSVSDLAEEVSLSASTLSRIINKMLALRLIRETGKQRTKSGRNKVLYTLNGQYRYVIAIFIDKDSVSLSIADFCGTTVQSTMIPAKGHSQEGLMEQICRLAEKMMRQWADRAEIGCIGVCVSGTVVAGGESAFVTVADLPDWRDKEIKRFFEERLGIETFVEKDTVVCLVGASRLPAAQGKESIVFVRIDVGIGSAIMLRNQIYRGRNNFAGEIRNMVVDSFRRLSPLSQPEQRGESLSELERMYGVRNILRKAFEIYRSGENGILNAYLDGQGAVPQSAGDLDLRDLDAAARLGDPRIIRLLHEPVQIWASLIINLCCCIAPDLIMVGGRVHSETPYLVGSIKALVEAALGQSIGLLPVSSSGFLENAINSYAVTSLYKSLGAGCLRDIVY